LNYFLSQLPFFTAEVEGIIQGFHHRYHQAVLPLAFRSFLDETLLRVSGATQQAARSFLDHLLAFMADLPLLLLAPFLAYYFLRDSEEIGRWAARILPSGIRENFIGLWMEMEKILVSFLYGDVLVSLLVGLLTGVGLFLIGSQYAVILGIIVGLTDLIPYFGPVLGAIPLLAFTLLEGKRKAMLALVILLAVQQLECIWLGPKILGDRVGLHPLVVIFLLLAGGEVAGLWGLLLAVPIAAMGWKLLKFFWERLVGSG